MRVGGILASVNRRVNKNGMPWASAQLEDLTGGIEVMFFPHTYSSYGADIVDDAVVVINARVKVQDDRICLVANDLVVPDFSNVQPVRPLEVSLPPANAQPTRSMRSSKSWPGIPGLRRCICGCLAETGSRRWSWTPRFG
ncbi:OB-fold nucleic acid binding domain protein [Mycobacterium xenopi 3993]|nr:OB-fold nucleic acid binding domain protein [Mycobacterium xenopi 3993]